MIPAYWSPTKKLMVLGAMAGGKLVEDTATGNPLVFITDKAKPLKSLLIPFAPQQSGTGDPSPENVRPILPWNGLTVFGGGKNLLNPATLEQGGIADDGTETVANNRVRTGFIPVKGGVTYTVSATGFASFQHLYNANKESIGTNKGTTTTTTPETAFVRCFFRKDGNPPIIPSDVTDGMYAVGSTATAYEPYHQITDTDIVFPSPVYGGELEAVSGKLLNEWIALVFDGSSDEAWGDNGSNGYYIPAPVGVSAEWIKLKSNYLKGLEPGEGRFLTDWTCRLNLNVTNLLVKPDMTNITSVSAWKAYLAENPLTIVCPLATPQEIQLTPAQLTALIGNNTIWSDADGQMTAVYLKKG